MSGYIPDPNELRSRGPSESELRRRRRLQRERDRQREKEAQRLQDEEDRRKADEYRKKVADLAISKIDEATPRLRRAADAGERTESIFIDEIGDMSTRFPQLSLDVAYSVEYVYRKRGYRAQVETGTYKRYWDGELEGYTTLSVRLRW